MFFFFKQKTAYELRISDWSSDVCSSDLPWRALDLLNMLDDLYREVGGRYPRPMFNPGAGWQLKGKCRTRSTIDWVGAVSSTPQAVWRNFVNGCLSARKSVV